MEPITEFFMNIIREHVPDEFLVSVAAKLLQTPLVQAAAWLMYHDPLVSSQLERIVLNVAERVYYRLELDSSISERCYELGLLCKQPVEASCKEVAQNMERKPNQSNTPLPPFKKTDDGEFLFLVPVVSPGQTTTEVRTQPELQEENDNGNNKGLDVYAAYDVHEEISPKQKASAVNMTYALFDTDWHIEEAVVWMWPLARIVQNKYKTFKPLENIVGGFWSGVCNTQMGALLPPVHPFLSWRMYRRDKGFLWMGYHSGNKGVDVQIAREANAGECPTKALFKHHCAKAVPVFACTFEGAHRPQLYDLLDYAYDHSTPICLKAHVEMYPDDPVKAVTEFCNTTCWGFVDGALKLFSDHCLQSDPKLPEIIADLLAKEDAVNAQPAEI